MVPFVLFMSDMLALSPSAVRSKTTHFHARVHDINGRAHVQYTWAVPHNPTDQREVDTSNEKPRVVAHKYIKEASIDVS
jgi:hypothetical protein